MCPVPSGIKSRPTSVPSADRHDRVSVVDTPACVTSRHGCRRPRWEPRPRASSMKVDPCGYLDDKDRGDEPVDSGAERRPPPGVGHVLTTVLPEVLEPVTGVAGNEQPHCCGHAG